jgi:CHAD domain
MKARRVKKLDPATSLAENAARIVLVRLDELRSLAPKALAPTATRAQHDMRIAAKRLRYILEITELCFGRPAPTARRQARALQDVLGELHDCEVMLPRVERHVAELRQADAEALRGRAAGAPDLEPELTARAPNRTLYRGLEVLAVYLEARRGILHDRFRGLWAEQEGAAVWERLERDAERVLRQARQRRRAEQRAAEARRELERAQRERREADERAARAAAALAEANAASPRVDGTSQEDIPPVAGSSPAGSQRREH